MLHFDILLAASSWLAVLLGLAWILCRDVKQSGYSVKVYLAFRAVWIFAKIWHNVRWHGPEPLPETGPAILVSNHVSPADPLFLQGATCRVVSFMMAREFFELKWLRWVFNLSATIPVNRSGVDTAATRSALRTLKSGGVLGIFPEAGINTEAGRLRAARGGAALLALKTRVPIIPAFVLHPHPTNDLRQGVLRRANARIVFGKAVDLSAYYGRENDKEVIEQVTGLLMRSIEHLRPGGSKPDLEHAG